MDRKRKIYLRPNVKKCSEKKHKKVRVLLAKKSKQIYR